MHTNEMSPSRLRGRGGGEGKIRGEEGESENGIHIPKVSLELERQLDFF